MLTLAENFKSWDVRVAMPFTSDTKSIFEDLKKRGLPVDNLDISEKGVLITKWISEILQFIRTFMYLRKQSPDIVHVVLPWPTRATWAIFAAVLSGAGVVVSFGLVGKIKSPFLKKRILVWCKNRGSRWIAKSENNRQILSDVLGVKKDDINVVYNGVSSSKFSFDSAKRKALRNKYLNELVLEENSKIITTVARLRKRKGYEYLFDAIPYIVNRYPHIHFLWCGDGEPKEDLKTQLLEKSIEKNVHMLGYRKDIPQLLAASDIFVLPTLLEGGQSFALAEAMLVGLPCVATDVSGIPEVIKNEKNGLLVHPKEPRELADAIIRLLDNPKFALLLGSNAKERAKDFSEEKMIERTFRIYKETLK